MKNIFRVVSVTLVLSTSVLAQNQDWSSLEQIFGKKGTAQGDAFKVTFPRTDLTVRIGRVVVAPGLALTSWVAIKQMRGHAMMMGDMVLLDREVALVLPRFKSNSIEITAIHNHLATESPAIKYIHFSGIGDAKTLASAILNILSVTATPLKPATPTPTPTAPNWGAVEQILGLTGTHNGILLQFGIPRCETIMDDGMEVPPFMGMATAINMQQVRDSAAATGDFVLTADEVNPVLQTLVEHGITVTALHNHMISESPRLFFMHFWGFDKPENLARGLRAALEKTNSAMSN
jgi:hypothetical protein